MPHFSRFDMPQAAAVGAQSVTVGASPFAYAAPMDGVLIVSGGTISLITYGRQAAVSALGLVSGVIPVQKGDVITITWLLTPPAVTFLANRLQA